MAEAFIKLHRFTLEPEFRVRVAIAGTRVALAVYDEDSQTAGHAARAKFATFVLNQPELAAPRLVYALIGTLEGTYGGHASVTDAAMETALNTAWNALAGA